MCLSGNQTRKRSNRANQNNSKRGGDASGKRGGKCLRGVAKVPVVTDKNRIVRIIY